MFSIKYNEIQYCLMIIIVIAIVILELREGGLFKRQASTAKKKCAVPPWV